MHYSYAGTCFVAALTVLLVTEIWLLFKTILWRPYALTKYFKKQGISGPPFSLLSGSLDEIKKLKKAAREIDLDFDSDITERVLPHYYKWSKKYGNIFLYWQGLEAHLCISDPELAKHVLLNKSGFYPKARARPSIRKLAGNGMVFLNGQDWARHKRIIGPAFSMDKLKDMVKRMTACAIPMLDEWKNQATQAGNHRTKIDMNLEFQKLTADIIAHTAFGSDYVHGKEAFESQRELQRYSAAATTNLNIPGSQYLPTPSNIQIWKLDKKIRSSLRSIIENRLNSETNSRSDCGYGDDLLGMMIAALKTCDDNQDLKLSMAEIMEECKTFFFAGHETTSNLLTFTIFLLSIHPDWQAKLREEVLNECGMGIPDGDMLAKFKLVNMVLLEALRLYGPLMMVIREASKTMELGNLTIPKHTILTIPITKIHRSKEYWGDDANEFNPMRFMNGVSKAAKHPNALLAFSMGPRVCIGQNFAMLEAKAVVALIVQRFSFSLSPSYKHAPLNNLTLQPQFGLPVLVQPSQIGYSC